MKGDATASWHVETTRGWRDERGHNLVVFWVQLELTDKVTAMVVARIERNPEQLCVQKDELHVVSDVVQKEVRTLGHCKDLQAKLVHPSVSVLGGPKQF